MGVKGLYSYLKAYRHSVDPLTGPPLRIGFDAMSILYKYKSNYASVYPFLKQLKEHGHTLLFVFDGKPPAEKEEEVKERREARQGAATQAATLKEQLHSAKAKELSTQERQILEYSVARLEFQGWHMTREIRHLFQEELWTMGIPYVKGIQEADMVLVDLVAAGKLDVVVSSDMDFLLSSVPRLWVPHRNQSHGFEEVALKEVLEGERLSEAAFQDACILCGVEPLRGRVNVNTNIAFSWLRYYKSIEGILGSSLKEPQLECLREEGLLGSVRRHFEPRADWTERIRPDHLERFRSFLDTL
jgi:5'-3' exonuclease